MSNRRDHRTATFQRGIARRCPFCSCRYAVERVVRSLDSAHSRAKPHTGRTVERGVWCGDCGADLDPAD
jgi:hypothetical protein